MDGATQAVPSYRLHKASGQAIVTLGGRMIYLGPWESPESREKYARVLGEWEARGRFLPAHAAEAAGLTVDDLLAAFWRHAETYYRKDGEPTGELACIRRASQFAHRLYGTTRAAEFGPLALKACREAMIREGLSRSSVNRYAARVKLCFRWGVENELVPPECYHGLRAVPGLKRGRCSARETEPVRPVTEPEMRAVLPFVSRQVAAMIELQWLSGMRPNEVVQMRGADLDVTGPVWLFRPARHKVEHFDIERVVALGPKAQEILRPFLKLDPQAALFSPAEAERERLAERRRCRRTKLWPSHRARLARARARRRRPPGEVYDVATYRRAITRACGDAGIPPWSPNQLRHAAATRIRKESGVEGAQAVLGHRLVETTQIYAEINGARAAEVMQRIG